MNAPIPRPVLPLAEPGPGTAITNSGILTMKHSRIMRGLKATCLALATLALTSRANAQDSAAIPQLTVDYIMRDLKWLGSQPSQVYWSADSRKLYFNWNPNGADGDSLYVVERSGGAPKQATLDE